MKINLLLLAMLTSVVLNAQISKGSLFIGGDLNISGSRYKAGDSPQTTSTNHQYGVSPVLGWAVKENLIVGGRLLVSISRTSYEPQSTESNAHSFGGGVFVRKYLPLGKSFYLFGDAGLIGQYNYMEQINVQQPAFYSEQKGFSIAATLYPGVAYQVKKSLFLEASLNNLVSLNYGHSNLEQHAGSSSSNATTDTYHFSSSLGNNIPLQIGVRWIIPKKVK